MDKLLTATEIADYLDVKPSTIYQWTHQGFIPHVKLGKLVRFKKEDVSNWVEKRSNPGRVMRRIDVRNLGL